ncbi:MAG TPA: septal ring lytic transglycosylase RlpA family protein [Bryobacteraceae bacterium]|nr:septal ring lytic transglycosylase RlpA family protein [Bryobacteraceae bacterium]
MTCSWRFIHWAALRHAKPNLVGSGESDQNHDKRRNRIIEEHGRKKQKTLNQLRRRRVHPEDGMMGRDDRLSRKIILLAAALALVLTASSCARKHKHKTAAHANPPPNVTPRRETKPNPTIPSGYSEQGIASWYGIPFNGRPAADGEIYDMEAMVAAHRLLPFNTWLKVTNLANNQSVNVRVIDRGPFVNGRIIDLSKAAARQIGLLGPGIGEVRLEVISAPRDIPANDFYAVQAGAFSSRENAERLREKYAERFGNAQLALKHGPVPLWRVLVGKEPSVEAANQLAIVLGAENKSVFVVRLDETEIQAAAAAGSR